MQPAEQEYYHSFEVKPAEPEPTTLNKFSNRLIALQEEDFDELAPDPDQDYIGLFFEIPSRFLRLLKNPTQPQLRYGNAMLDDVENSFKVYKNSIDSNARNYLSHTAEIQNRTQIISTLLIDCWKKQISYLQILLTDIQNPAVRKELREKIKKIASEIEKNSAPETIKSFFYADHTFSLRPEVKRLPRQLALLAYEITEQAAVDEGIDTVRALNLPVKATFTHTKPLDDSGEKELNPTQPTLSLDKHPLVETPLDTPPSFDVDLTNLSKQEPTQQEVSTPNAKQIQDANMERFKREQRQNWFKRTAQRAAFFLSLAGAATGIYKASESPSVQTLAKDTLGQTKDTLGKVFKRPATETSGNSLGLTSDKRWQSDGSDEDQEIKKIITEIKEGQKEKAKQESQLAQQTQESLDKVLNSPAKMPEVKEPQTYPWGAKTESRYSEHALAKALRDNLGVQADIYSDNMVENLKGLMAGKKLGEKIKKSLDINENLATGIPQIGKDTNGQNSIVIKNPDTFKLLAQALYKHTKEHDYVNRLKKPSIFKQTFGK